MAHSESGVRGRYSYHRRHGPSRKVHRASSYFVFPETSSICSSPLNEIVLISLASRSMAWADGGVKNPNVQAYRPGALILEPLYPWNLSPRARNSTAMG